MKIKAFLIQFAIVFITFFVINMVVTSLWTIIRYGRGFIIWDNIFIFAIVLGIALPLINLCKQRIK